MTCSQDGHPGSAEHENYESLLSDATQGRWINLEAGVGQVIRGETVIKYCENCKVAFVVK